MLDRIPKSISPCPIKQSIVEIRFKTSFPADTISGIVHQSFSKEFPDRKALPVAEVPRQIILENPNLLEKPHYKYTQEPYTLQVGPKVFSLSVTDSYIGWKQFYKKIESCFETFFRLNISEKITRVGIRYVNFFDDHFLNTPNFDIFNNVELTFDIPNINRNKNEKFIRTTLEDGNFISNLIILNRTKYKNMDGSIIDIDTWYKNDVNNENIYEIIQKGRTILGVKKTRKL